MRDSEVLLIGTAHVSRESVDLVRETIEKEAPDVVAVELCEQRHHSIAEKKRWEDTDITKVIRGGKAYLFMLQLLLTNFQRKVGDEIGVKPGSEMVEALNIAKEKGISIALVDRDIGVTLKRAMNRMTLREKSKVLFGLVYSAFGEDDDVTEEMIEKLKEMDVLNEMMEELGREVPSVKEVLLDERNRYIADKIACIEGKKIVAVVGAGHVGGIRDILESDYGTGFLDRKVAEGDISALEEVPEPRKWVKYAANIIPMSVLFLIAIGFVMYGGDFLWESAVKWIFTTGILAALGTALALGHPLSILTSFLVAPITTIHPLLAAGWFAGLVEAKIRKPKVKDFEGLMQIDSIFDLWSNGVTRILLVIAFANMGASLGVFVAGASIFADVIPGL